MNQMYGRLRKLASGAKVKSRLLLVLFILCAGTSFLQCANDVKVYRVKHMLVADAELFLSLKHPEINVTALYSQNILLLKGKLPLIDKAISELELNDIPVEEYYLMDITVKKADIVLYKGTQLLPFNKESRFQRSKLAPVMYSGKVKMISLGHFFTVFLSRNLHGLNLNFVYIRKTAGETGDIEKKIKSCDVTITDSNYVTFDISGLDIRIALKELYQKK